MPNTLCIIPARYHATRFPGKPLVEFRGVPLIIWPMRAAIASGRFSHVVVATDDRRIADCVEAFGGRAMMTASNHPSGTDRVWEAAQSLSGDFIVNLQGDEPDIPPGVLETLTCRLQKIDNNSLLTVVCNATIREKKRPDVVKVVCNARMEALYFSRAPIPCDRDGEELPGLKHAGIYGFSRKSLEKFATLQPGILEQREKLEQLRALEAGMTIHCIQSEQSWTGIDTPEDAQRFRLSLNSDG